MNAEILDTTKERRSSWCGSPMDSGRIVYAGFATKAEFDLLSSAERVGEWAACKTTTLLRNDGNQWERRCHSKVVGSYGADEVTVIFQWWDERVAGSEA
ncbi:hypothetical protein L2Y94_05565 [Luteibacter aegosomatis]|uniref:hypothetical protein n=1 Tax=Luteibacter aegosomatis TaxID=2911537 RepID=UPI001FFB5B7D|nr:hypothetical protein [Luteibacter aegosomatis]UPG86822.1 hypothetical protein L2Y94_05565 [Luteibacter aegosomatis]